MIEIADPLARERGKYEAIWGFDQYRQNSPGLVNVNRFMDLIKPPVGRSLIDFGCGDGRAGLEFDKLGLKVTWLDLTDAGLVPEVERKRFIQAPVWQRLPFQYDYGFCCDVLEHLPTEYVMLAVARMAAACDTLWLQIALRADEFGQLVGEPLHLTVRTFRWWVERLATVAKLEEARDLIDAGLFVVRQ